MYLFLIWGGRVWGQKQVNMGKKECLKVEGEREWNKYLKEQLKSRRPEKTQASGQSRSEWNIGKGKTQTHTKRYRQTTEINKHT